MNILFVCWDGPQNAYLEGLFAPIFQALGAQGHRFHALQFTWGDRERTRRTARACEALGVGYESHPIVRRPAAPGAFWTALRGASPIRRAIERFEVDVVLPRSTLPALACMRALPRHPRVRMVFDADGLPHDERVDFGGWSPSSAPYRILRDLEAQAVRRSDAVLTRSERAIDILVARAGAGISRTKFYCVGNGRDEHVFRPATVEERQATRSELGVPDSAPLLAYAGSLGPQYYPDEMMGVFARVLRERTDARLLLLTGSREQAQALLEAHPSMAPACIVRQAAPHDVPRYLGAADVGLALRRATFSMQAVLPIKLGEYLLCGLPVIASAGIGDTERTLSEATGIMLTDTATAELDRAAAWILRTALPQAAGFRERCREAGLAHFGLSATVAAYARALAAVA